MTFSFLSGDNQIFSRVELNQSRFDRLAEHGIHDDFDLFAMRFGTALVLFIVENLLKMRVHNFIQTKPTNSRKDCPTQLVHIHIVGFFLNGVLLLSCTGFSDFRLDIGFEPNLRVIRYCQITGH